MVFYENIICRIKYLFSVFILLFSSPIFSQTEAIEDDYLHKLDFELEEFKIKTEFGNKYSLNMSAFHNGKQVSQRNMKDKNWTFAEIIEGCSYGTEIYPGDVNGSGTVGTGCHLELNGIWALEAKAKGEEHSPIWLKDGNTIKLQIDGIGRSPIAW